MTKMWANATFPERPDFFWGEYESAEKDPNTSWQGLNKEQSCLQGGPLLVVMEMQPL